MFHNQIFGGIKTQAMLKDSRAKLKTKIFEAIHNEPFYEFSEASECSPGQEKVNGQVYILSDALFGMICICYFSATSQCILLQIYYRILLHTTISGARQKRITVKSGRKCRVNQSRRDSFPLSFCCFNPFPASSTLPRVVVHVAAELPVGRAEGVVLPDLHEAVRAAVLVVGLEATQLKLLQHELDKKKKAPLSNFYISVKFNYIYDSKPWCNVHCQINSIL